jgi:hypothetical protein
MTSKFGRARAARFAKGAARRATLVAVAMAMLIGMAGMNTGCFKQQVQVGTGGTGAERTEMRQWFVLWGLVPITQIDPEGVVAGADNYTVESIFTPLDVIIGIFTSFVTIYPKTIAIEK